MTIEKTMVIIHSDWNKSKTFRMIPLTQDSCYQEAIYIPDTKVMVLISKIPTQKYTMVPKLDDNGDLMRLKGAPRPGGQTYKEERRLMDTFQEFYLETEPEIIEFMSMFALNYDRFDYLPYMHPVAKSPAKSMAVVPKESPVMENEEKM